MDANAIVASKKQLASEINAAIEALNGPEGIIARANSAEGAEPVEIKSILDLLFKILRFFRWLMPKGWKIAVDMTIILLSSIFPDDPAVDDGTPQENNFPPRPAPKQPTTLG